MKISVDHGNLEGNRDDCMMHEEMSAIWMVAVVTFMHDMLQLCCSRAEYCQSQSESMSQLVTSIKRLNDKGRLKFMNEVVGKCSFT